MEGQCISPEVTVTSSKKCCITSEVARTDYRMLRNGSEEGGNVKSECDEDGNGDTNW